MRNFRSSKKERKNPIVHRLESGDFNRHEYLSMDSLRGDLDTKCEEFVAKNLTIVRISVTPWTINVIDRTLRVTFSDQLASLGTKPVIA